MKPSHSKIEHLSKQTTSIGLVLPIFGSNEVIRPTLLTIKNQSVPFEEIVIVDDNPNLPSREHFMKELFGDVTNLKYFKNSTNLGSAASLNLGIDTSTSDIIVLCNDDDLFESSRSAKILDNVRSVVHPVFWGFTSVACIDENGTFVPASNTPKVISEAIAMQTHNESFLRRTKNQNIIISSGNLFLSREIWSKAGKFNPDLTHVHDWEIAIKFGILIEPIFIEEEIYSYRLHAGNSFKKIESEVTSIEVEKLRKTCEDFFWKYGNRGKLIDYFPEFIRLTPLAHHASSGSSSLGNIEFRVLFLFDMIYKLLIKRRLLFTLSKYVFKKIESLLVFLTSK